MSRSITVMELITELLKLPIEQLHEPVTIGLFREFDPAGSGYTERYELSGVVISESVGGFE